METRRLDFVVLGSGSTAFAAAIRAAELGKTVAMTENRTLGGTCVNRGCLPSKNLIAAATILHDAAHPRYPGIEPARLRFDFSELIRQKDEVIAYYREKQYQSIVGDRISVFEGSGRFVERNAVQVGDVRLKEGWFRASETVQLSQEEGRILRERWVEEARQRAALSDEQAERLSRLIQERWDATLQQVHQTGGPSAWPERQKWFGQMLEEIVKESAVFLTPAQSSTVREVLLEVRRRRQG